MVNAILPLVIRKNHLFSLTIEYFCLRYDSNCYYFSFFAFAFGLYFFTCHFFFACIPKTKAFLVLYGDFLAGKLFFFIDMNFTMKAEINLACSCGLKLGTLTLTALGSIRFSIKGLCN